MLVAVSYGGVRWPRKNGTNWTMPALTEQQVGSSRTTDALGTSVWPAFKVIEEPLLISCVCTSSLPWILLIDRPTLPFCWSTPTKLRRTERQGLSLFRSTSTIDCQVPSNGRPACTGTVTDGATMAGSMVGAVPVRAVRMAVAVIARQQPFQGGDQVLLGARAGLEDGDAGGGVRHEHVAQPVSVTRRRRSAPHASGRPVGGGWCRCPERRFSHVQRRDGRTDAARPFIEPNRRGMSAALDATWRAMTITGIISAIIGIVVGILEPPSSCQAGRTSRFW